MTDKFVMLKRKYTIWPQPETFAKVIEKVDGVGVVVLYRVSSDDWKRGLFYDSEVTQINDLDTIDVLQREIAALKDKLIDHLAVTLNGTTVS